MPKKCSPGAHRSDAVVAKVDRDRAVAAVRELLFAVGADPDRPALARTPQRVADLYIDLFSQIDVDPATALGVPLQETETGDVVSVAAIPFNSICEHHLLPFTGLVDVYYAPSGYLAGLSRMASLVEAAAHRPQLQERLGMDIAKAIMRVLEPRGVIVRIQAKHGCIIHHQPGTADSLAVTVAQLGTISPEALSVAMSDVRM